MPFIPTTDDDIKAMLNSIGLNAIEDLFSEIPKDLRIQELSAIPPASNEMTLFRELKTLSKKDAIDLNFIGAGAYEHYIPAAVWELVSRGEWLTAYTPYQAEASQGTLQLLYEYQSMMAGLMQMEVSNASLYDGASALAEAVLMAVRCHPKKSVARILMPNNIHPFYREVVRTILQAQSIEIIELPFSLETGCIEKAHLESIKTDDLTAVIIPQPNFFGVLEDVDMLVDFAREKGALAIALVNPISMAMLKPPGLWGKERGQAAGVDIACGEGQPLGIPLASGGPYFGFLCCKKKYIRQLPGRLVGRTVDTNGKTGFTLTLQAREQHIRRARATSNICTNQGLLVAAATVYLSLMGNAGLERVAMACHAKTVLFRKKIKAISKQLGLKILFEGSPFFHETVIQLDASLGGSLESSLDDSLDGSLNSVLKHMTAQGIEPGFDLRPYYPELGNSLLVCVTETKTEKDLDVWCEAL